LCSGSVILENKLLLQELNELIGIELLTSGFPEIFGFYTPFPRDGKCPFCLLPSDAHVGDITMLSSLPHEPHQVFLFKFAAFEQRTVHEKTFNIYA